MKAIQPMFLIGLIASQMLFGSLSFASVTGDGVLGTKVGVTVSSLVGDPVDLGGNCHDNARRQLHSAKDFAYNNLGYASRQSLEWARQYNETHRCNTIGAFSARYQRLYKFAYEQLQLSYEDARAYALARVEKNSVQMIDRMKEQYLAIFKLVSHTMGVRAERSQVLALKWIARQQCEGPRGIARIAQAFEVHFRYADETMNLSSAEARVHARRKIRKMSVCADLLNQAR
jgi:hypothetical protein